jgi:hypothetical protein
MRRSCWSIGIVLALTSVGCGEGLVESNHVNGSASFEATRTAVDFTVGPLTTTGISFFFPDGRFHLRDVMLTGPVSGDLVGTTNITLNANLDQFGGSGPAWGTVTIVTTNGDVWQGALTGSFQGDGPAGGPAIQLFSQVVLHGPDQQLLKAECDETSATSETLNCSGEILTVHS